MGKNSKREDQIQYARQITCTRMLIVNQLEGYQVLLEAPIATRVASVHRLPAKSPAVKDHASLGFESVFFCFFFGFLTSSSSSSSSSMSRFRLLDRGSDRRLLTKSSSFSSSP